MRKHFSLVLVLLFVLAVFGMQGDIKPKHTKPYFIWFDTFGVSVLNVEISTNPLSDILGLFNGNMRYYINNNNVIGITGFLWDYLFILDYAPSIKENFFNSVTLKEYPCFFNINGYYHANIPIGNNFMIKSHVELMDGGIAIKNVLNNSYNFNINILAGKTYGQIGYYPSKELEFFAGAETGMVLNTFMPNTANDENLKKLNDEIRKNSFYVMSRAGLRWYYGNNFGVELGYRMPIVNSYGRIISGNSSEFIYNYYGCISKISKDSGYNGSDISNLLPFITTDYYFAFTTFF